MAATSGPDSAASASAPAFNAPGAEGGTFSAGRQISLELVKRQRDTAGIGGAAVRGHSGLAGSFGMIRKARSCSLLVPHLA